MDRSDDDVVVIHTERCYDVNTVARRWKVNREWVIRRIKAGLIRAMVLPCKLNSRKRIFLIRRILGAEVLRIEKDWIRPA